MKGGPPFNSLVMLFRSGECRLNLRRVWVRFCCWIVHKLMEVVDANIVGLKLAARSGGFLGVDVRI